jgi:hypothetical protein
LLVSDYRHKIAEFELLGKQQANGWHGSLDNTLRPEWIVGSP